MINILTGLPVNKQNDKHICIKFANTVGTKIILGSSTMKMYCREFNIKPIIKIIKLNNLLTPQYFIEGIDISCEGVITLNEIYKILLNQYSSNIEANKITDFLKQTDKINFIVGTANNNENDFYKQNNLFSRVDVIKRLIEILKSKQIMLEYI